MLATGKHRDFKFAALCCTLPVSAYLPVAVPDIFVGANAFLISRPFAVPKISCSLIAHEILTAAHAYAPLHLPPAARGNAAAATRSARLFCHRQRSHRSPSRLLLNTLSRREGGPAGGGCGENKGGKPNECHAQS